MNTRDELIRLGSAMLHEARGRRGAVGPTIGPAWPGARVCGPAYTVYAPVGDNLAAHIALERCSPGDILCLATPEGGAYFGAWGEVLARYAMARGVCGLVTTTGVRDIEQIERLGFPIFSATGTIQGTIKQDGGRHGTPVVIGAAVVRPGDWIVGDADGLAVVPSSELRSAVAGAKRKTEAEESAFILIERGKSTREALGF